MRNRWPHFTDSRPSAAPSPPALDGWSTSPCDRPRACRIRRRSGHAAWAPQCSTRRGASETTFEVSRVHGPTLSYETRGGWVTRDPAGAPRHPLDSRPGQKVGTFRRTMGTRRLAQAGGGRGPGFCHPLRLATRHASRSNRGSREGRYRSPSLLAVRRRSASRRVDRSPTTVSAGRHLIRLTPGISQLAY